MHANWDTVDFGEGKDEIYFIFKASSVKAVCFFVHGVLIADCFVTL